MIGLFALVMAQAAAPEAKAEPPSEEDVAREIVAINRTLDKWKGGIFKQDGKVTCRMQASSGDEAVDILRCGAMVGCYTPHVDRLDAIAASDATREEKQAEMQAVTDEVQPCVEQAHRQGVRRLAIVRASL